MFSNFYSSINLPDSFCFSRDLSGNAISTLIPEHVKRLPSKLLIL